MTDKKPKKPLALIERHDFVLDPTNPTTVGPDYFACEVCGFSRRNGVHK